MSNKNWFDSKGQEYANFRPGYPDELIKWVANKAQQHGLVWDCATGNGQAACALAMYFDKVIATDSAESQLQAAVSHPQVDYRVATAQHSGLDSDSVDCVTVAQAMHWFANDVFFDEVKRVAKSGASMAAWCYTTPVLSDEALNKVWQQCYTEYLHPYFNFGREYVEKSYSNIPFPFAKQQSRTFRQAYRWSVARFMDYLKTLSAAKKYMSQFSIDLVDEKIKPRLLSVFPDIEKEIDVYFDMTVRQGVVEK